MINRVLIAGRLGKDPVLKYTQAQQPVCRFSVATTEKRGGEDHTEWHNVITWGKTAEFCEKYLAKGRMVFVEGKIGTRSWEKDGEKHQMTEINAHNVQFLDSPPKAEEASKKAPFPRKEAEKVRPPEPKKKPEDYDDLSDIPF